MDSRKAVRSAELARIEAGRRLVEAQKRRLGTHGARNLEPALSTVGKVAGRIVGALHEADLVEPVFGALHGSGLGLDVAARPEEAQHRPP